MGATRTSKVIGPPWTIVVRLALIAGMYFALHAIILTVVPEALRAGGESARTMGVGVGVYIAAGMILDVPLSRFAQHVSLRISLVFGACATAALLPAYYLATHHGGPLWLSLVIVFILGAASSALQGPVLGGLASSAGARSQLKAQVMNATVQRTGGLGASIAIGAWLPTEGLWAVVLAGSVVSFITVLLSTGAHQVVKPSREKIIVYPNRNISLNRDIFSALIGNTIIQTLLITGYSFFPAYLEYIDRDTSLGWLLGVRESGAVLFALLMLLLAGRKIRQLRCVFLVLLFLAVIGLVIFPVLSFPLVVINFVIQGAVIGTGIILFNIHIFIGTTEWNRITMYGVTSAIGRLIGVILPLVAGFILSEWIDGFPLFVGLLIGTMGITYLFVASKREEVI